MKEKQLPHLIIADIGDSNAGLSSIISKHKNVIVVDSDKKTINQILEEHNSFKITAPKIEILEPIVIKHDSLGTMESYLKNQKTIKKKKRK